MADPPAAKVHRTSGHPTGRTEGRLKRVPNLGCVVTEIDETSNPSWPRLELPVVPTGAVGETTSDKNSDSEASYGLSPKTSEEKTDKGLGRRTSRDKLKSLLQALCHSSGDLRRRQIRGGLRRFVDGSAIHRLRWLFQGPSLRKAARHTIQRPGLDPPSHPLAFVPSTIEADKIKP